MNILKILTDGLGGVQAALKKPAATRDELVKTRETAEATVREAAAEIARLAAARPAILVDGDDAQLAAHDAAAAFAARTVERANAMIGPLTDRIGAAEYEIEQRRRRQVVAEAMKIVNAADERTQKEIPELLRLFLGVHECLAAAKRAFSDAFHDRPDGDVDLAWPDSLKTAIRTLDDVPGHAIPLPESMVRELRRNAELFKFAKPSTPAADLAKRIQAGLKFGGG